MSETLSATVARVRETLEDVDETAFKADGQEAVIKAWELVAEAAKLLENAGL